MWTIEKSRGSQDIFLAPPGLGGLEVTLPLMLSAVHQHRLTLPRLVRLLSERAGELFGLPGKGRIAEGYDADLVLVDLTARWTFDCDHCLTRSRESMRIYHGRPMRGRVVTTLVRGEPVYHEGEITAHPGHGKLVRPEHPGSRRRVTP
jgi:allantoinase